MVMVAQQQQVRPALGIRRGMAAPSVVRKLVANGGEVLAVELRTYRVRKNVRARIAAGEDKLLALAAHDQDAVDPVRLGQARVRAHAVQRMIDHYVPDDDHAFALSSRVETVHGQRFLLLLDFACPVGEEQLADVVRACQFNGWRGAVLESGSSYHFMGFEPMEFGAWVAAMGRALLLSGLIDVRYMGHALARGAGALRLHACEAKPTMPRVVALVGRGA